MTHADFQHAFLVSIEIVRPVAIPAETWDALLTQESERGRELVERGHIRGIWRVVGQTANVGIWEASSHQELHAALASLPLFPYMTIKVDPLCAHPLGDFTVDRGHG